MSNIKTIDEEIDEQEAAVAPVKKAKAKAPKVVKAKAKWATPTPPAKAPAKVAAKAKPAKVAKAKAKVDRIRDPAKLDQFGLRKGSIKSQAAAMYAKAKGATLGDVKGVLGSVQFNVLKELEAKGFTIDKTEVKGTGTRSVTRYKIHPPRHCVIQAKCFV